MMILTLVFFFHGSITSTAFYDDWRHALITKMRLTITLSEQERGSSSEFSSHSLSYLLVVVSSTRVVTCLLSHYIELLFRNPSCSFFSIHNTVLFSTRDQPVTFNPL